MDCDQLRDGAMNTKCYIYFNPTNQIQKDGKLYITFYGLLVRTAEDMCMLDYDVSGTGYTSLTVSSCTSSTDSSQLVV